MTIQAPPTQTPSSRLTPTRESHARRFRGLGWGFLIKLALMALVNAFGIMTVISAWSAQSWVVLGVVVLLVVIADWVYFTRRALPLKYLMPGLIFLLVFQVFIFGYTAYIAFTNYGTGHVGTQEQAVEAALIQGERRIEGSADYPLSIVQRGDELGFAIVDEDGDVRVGSADAPLAAASDAEIGATGAPSDVPGWTVVPRATVLTDTSLGETIKNLRVPVSDDPNDGSIRTREGSTGSVYEPTLVWDAEAQTISDTQNGTVYTATALGAFVAEDGTALPTGWSVNVGFANFLKLFTDASLAGTLLSVTVWTFAFAILSVVLSFAVGLGLAIVYNDPRVKGRRFLRALFILPYAFPAFMAALLFRGMFNAEFGIINDLFFFGSQINWLGDPWLTRGAVIFVNVWLSYPYWFLVCTGALQSLPGDTLEAAEIDGANKFQRFRSIVLPLLLVSTAPLLIASFAVAFNNFTVIYTFNNGGPAIAGAPYALGSTDILVSAIYDVSGVSGGAADYGLASALSIVAFIVVGLISALSFRQTRKLEEYQ
ncbi:ABC transporter permease subunit [Microbacterium oxydans]|uniref:Maltose/maltodextrin transport system permease protein n=1 Tax=Microbacterium oxydans TaxID=82380 RepID=A0A0F0LHS5_9MICO|nr:ABC transporter permease subunit [Microbacterium oxydans]KJL31111.1 Maltose transport system permease protein MalF [Microbacterium oxydans]